MQPVSLMDRGCSEFRRLHSSMAAVARQMEAAQSSGVLSPAVRANFRAQCAALRAESQAKLPPSPAALRVASGVAGGGVATGQQPFVAAALTEKR